MQAQHFLSFLALCAATTLAESLLAVLNENGFSDYAELLQGDPILSAGPGLIVYAPTNAVLNRNGNITVARRDGELINNDAGNSFSCVSLTAPTWTDPAGSGYGSGGGNASLVKRQMATYGSVYGTMLDDPEWVNLGPGRNQTLVEKSVFSASQPLVFSGLGQSVKVTASDIQFDGGIIRPIDGVLTLPRNLSYTLPFLGADSFGAALQKVGLLPDLDNRAIVTVLAPNDAAFKSASSWTDAQLKQVLKEHVLVGFPAYTPLLKNDHTYRTLGGSSVIVSVRDGTAYINGARIVAGDAILKNGVVHTIDKMLSTPVSLPTAAAMAKPLPWQSLVITLIGMAVAARHCFL